ncbi:hypothetical protein BV898_12812, partial [Hypsibius exemplaris]
MLGCKRCLVTLIILSIIATVKAFQLELISTMPLNVPGGFALPNTGAALEVAQSTVNSQYSFNLNLSVTLLFNRSDTICEIADVNGILLLTEYFNRRAFDRCTALIVSGCGGYVAGPYLAKEWDVLLFTNGWIPPTIYNHIDTPTSFGMAGSTQDSGSALLELLLFFKWFHATVLLDFTNGWDLNGFIATSIRLLLIRQRKYDVLSIDNVQFSTKDEQSMRDALRQANNRSRVFLMLGPTLSAIRLLRLLNSMAIFIPGSY